MCLAPVVIRDGGEEEGVSGGVTLSPSILGRMLNVVPLNWSPGLFGREASGVYWGYANGRRLHASGCPPNWEVLKFAGAMEEGTVGSNA